MKPVLAGLRAFIQKDFHPWIYGLTISFLISAMIFNFSVDFEDSMVDPIGSRYFGWPIYFLYYGCPYFLVIFLYQHFDKKLQLSRRFWLKAIFAIALLSFKAWFPFVHQLIPEAWIPNYYVRMKIASRVANVLIYTLGLTIFYKFFEVGNSNWYGLTTKEFNYRPYFYLLLFMVPLILWASFQPDFLAAYPRLHPDRVYEHYWKWFALFEPFYLFEFITLEWFFRGFLVVGMVRLLGRRAVLPMATLYCVFHFGKPLGECIGSFFGGYILGVIAYQTRSVWGGIIVHMGIALLMDLAAIDARIWLNAITRK